MNHFAHFQIPACPPPPPPDDQVVLYTYEQLRKLIPNLPRQPPPPPTEHIEDEPETHLPPKLVDITAEELEKWIASRKRNFPSRANRARKAQSEKNRKDRGEPVAELSRLEIKLRKRLAFMRNATRKVEERKGGNPFLKYLHLHKKLLTNQVLREHTVVLQCFRYLVRNKFFDETLATQANG